MGESMRWRKKPVEVEVLRWQPDDPEAVGAMVGWCMFACPDAYVSADKSLQIPTLEGLMTAQPDDWVIRGVKGEFYPCKPDIFEATYEPACATCGGTEQVRCQVHKAMDVDEACAICWIGEPCPDCQPDIALTPREPVPTRGARPMAEVLEWDVIDGEVLGAIIRCPDCPCLPSSTDVPGGTGCEGTGKLFRPYLLHGRQIDLHRNAEALISLLDRVEPIPSGEGGDQT